MVCLYDWFDQSGAGTRLQPPGHRGVDAAFAETGLAGNNETFAIEIKPGGIGSAQGSIAHSGCRGNGTNVVRTVRNGRKP